MSKVNLSRNLGQTRVSGQLNKVIRTFLADGTIESMMSDSPKPHQKYRLTSMEPGIPKNP